MFQGKSNTSDKFQRRMPNCHLSPSWCILRKMDSTSHCQSFSIVLLLLLVGLSFSMSLGIGVSWCFPLSYDTSVFQLLQGPNLKGGSSILWDNTMNATFWCSWENGVDLSTKIVGPYQIPHIFLVPSLKEFSNDEPLHILSN